MKYEITNETCEKIDENLITKVIEQTSKTLNIKDSLVNIVLVDNKFIHEINKKYRGIDAVTDVISFAYLDEETNPSGVITNLGEIYISLERTHEQALDYGHSFERELSFLTVHGLLHLLGYDHMNKSDEKKMFGLQEEILSSIGIER